MIAANIAADRDSDASPNRYFFRSANCHVKKEKPHS